MKKLIWGCLLIVALICTNCGGYDYFGDLPKPGNCNCNECYITIPPLFPSGNPLILNRSIEITDQNDKKIGEVHNFDITRSQRIKIECCKKVMIEILYFEACSAWPGQPIYSRFIECRGFVSPKSCDDNVGDIIYECLVHQCDVHPFL